MIEFVLRWVLELMPTLAAALDFQEMFDLLPAPELLQKEYYLRANHHGQDPNFSIHFLLARNFVEIEDSFVRMKNTKKGIVVQLT
jgi:hypothetical protein